jgi:hypothetical protein
MNDKSYTSADDIIDSAKSIPRPLELPSVTIGFMGDLIIKILDSKIKETKKTNH